MFVFGLMLVNMLYIFDELMVGFYLEDVVCLCILIIDFCDCGNMVVVVEYELLIIEVGDEVVEIGLNVGDGGGYVVF